MFNKYDKDGSGLIDKKEFRAMCYDLGYYLSEGETDVAFRTINVFVAPPPPQKKKKKNLRSILFLLHAALAMATSPTTNSRKLQTSLTPPPHGLLCVWGSRPDRLRGRAGATVLED